MDTLVNDYKDLERIFQALCTELERLERAGARRVGSDAISHCRELRDRSALALQLRRARRHAA